MQKGIIMQNELKEFRERHNLTQQALATLLGNDRQSIYNWERGATPAPAMLGLALQALEEKLQNQ
jgi:DNA-binding XRE family transcriptional regulator